MSDVKPEGVYGTLPPELADAPEEAIQFSPLVPGAEALEDRAEGSLSALSALAPPGTLERRYALALALRAVAPGGRLTVLAPKDKGGSRLGKELKGFGCAVSETSRRHHRICVCERPAHPSGIGEALAAGGPQFDETQGLWTQPGVFSWNRIDPGSALLLEHLPALSGRGADFGCGIGSLARPVLASAGVAALAMIDIDRRAIAAARRNVEDSRASFLWRDVRQARDLPHGLDFVVMNPPFHDGGIEDRALGESFIRRAAESLRPGGSLWLTANRHLPYEAPLKASFKRVALKVEAGGYKVYEAHR